MTVIQRLLLPFQGGCESLFDCGKAMIAEGRSAFLPVQEDWKAYCETVEEIESLGVSQIEEAKERLSYGIGPAISCQSTYKSPYLTVLRRRRDAENGVPYDRLSERFPDAREVLVRKEYHPAVQRMVRQRCFDFSLYEERWRLVRAEIQKIKSKEVDCLQREICTEGGIEISEKEKFRKFVRSVIVQEISENAKVVFNKNVVNIDWMFSGSVALRWKFTTPKMQLFIQDARYDPAHWFDAVLFAGKAGGFKKEDLSNGCAILLRYGVILPGFQQSYEQYGSMHEFLLNFSAHVMFLKNWLSSSSEFARKSR